MTRSAALIALVSLCLPGLARGDWTYDVESGKWSQTKARDTQGQLADELLGRAIAAQQQGNPSRAESLADDWLDMYEGQLSSESALFLLAEARRSRGHYFAAYESYEKLLDRYAGTNLYSAALAGQLEIAQAFLQGRRRRMWKVLRVGAQDEGLDMLDKIYQRDPRGPYGKAALLAAADYHFKQGKFPSAEDEYQRLVDNFPQDPQAAEWKLMAAQAALGRFRGTRYDARPLAEAEQRFKNIQHDNPKLAEKEQVPQILDAISQRRAEKMLQTADFYLKTEHPKAAIYYYRKVLGQFPGTVWSERARVKLVELGVEPVVAPDAPPKVVAVGVGDDALPADAFASPDDGQVVVQPSSSGLPTPPPAEPIIIERIPDEPAPAPPVDTADPDDEAGRVMVTGAGPAPAVRTPSDTPVIEGAAPSPPVIDNARPVQQNDLAEPIRIEGDTPPPATQPESE